jgi:hypothetical protein
MHAAPKPNIWLTSNLSYILELLIGVLLGLTFFEVCFGVPFLWALEELNSCFVDIEIGQYNKYWLSVCLFNFLLSLQSSLPNTDQENREFRICYFFNYKWSHLCQAPSMVCCINYICVTFFCLENMIFTALIDLNILTKQIRWIAINIFCSDQFTNRIFKMQNCALGVSMVGCARQIVMFNLCW